MLSKAIPREYILAKGFQSEDLCDKFHTQGKDLGDELGDGV